MHLKQADLLKQADKVRRILWASLPFEYRFAHVYLKLATSPQEAFGNVAYTAFLRHGITGMPLHNGKLPDVSGSKISPPGYGKEFGERAWRTMVSKYKNIWRSRLDDALSDAFQSASYQMHTASLKLSSDFNLRDAETYALKVVDNEVKMLFRSRKEERFIYDLDDPGARGRKIKRINVHQDVADAIEKMDFHSYHLPVLYKELAKIHPGAPGYIQALFDDPEATDVALVGDPLKGIVAQVPYFQENPISKQHFNSNIKPKILRVIEEFRRKEEEN
jgi:uncharacterized protein (DUF1778 family)